MPGVPISLARNVPFALPVVGNEPLMERLVVVVWLKQGGIDAARENIARLTQLWDELAEMSQGLRERAPESQSVKG